MVVGVGGQGGGTYLGVNNAVPQVVGEAVDGAAPRDGVELAVGVIAIGDRACAAACEGGKSKHIGGIAVAVAALIPIGVGNGGLLATSTQLK